MPEQLLTILKICFLVLLYLFFLRVLRAVWTELRTPDVLVGRPPAPPAAGAGPAEGEGKREGGPGVSPGPPRASTTRLDPT